MQEIFYASSFFFRLDDLSDRVARSLSSGFLSFDRDFLGLSLLLERFVLSRDLLRRLGSRRLEASLSRYRLSLSRLLKGKVFKVLIVLNVFDCLSFLKKFSIFV